MKLCKGLLLLFLPHSAQSVYLPDWLPFRPEDIYRLLCPFIPFYCNATTPTTPNPSPPPATTFCNPNPTTETVSQFHIGFTFKDVPPTEQTKLVAAANRWRQVIMGDISNATNLVGSSSSKCGPWPSEVDDVHICAAYEKIDGTGDTLGYAGPKLRRASGPFAPLTVTGELVLDLADLDYETWTDVLVRNYCCILLARECHGICDSQRFFHV